MPWTNQGSGGGGPWGGSGGGNRGPSGQGPWNRGGSQGPDLEELLRRGQERFRKVFSGGGGGNRGMALIAIAVILVVYLGSGFYRVQPDEQGVVLRFGQWVRTTPTGSGLNYHLPYPIETVLTPKVTTVNRADIGFRSGPNGEPRDVNEEALMLTGDENIVDINFTVFWVIKDAGQYLFNIRNPEDTVKAVAESAMREVIGKTKIQAALAEARHDIEVSSRDLLQQVLDHYGAGVQITQLQLQKVDPPPPVVEAFRDVQRARADADRARNEAEAYSNDILPRARGEAERIVQEGEAYKQQVLIQAQGDTQRFLSVYEQYRQAKDITTKRMYLETMEDILRNTNKIIIDQKGGSGVLPYLPLPGLTAKKPPAVPSAPAPSSPATGR